MAAVEPEPIIARIGKSKDLILVSSIDPLLSIGKILTMAKTSIATAMIEGTTTVVGDNRGVQIGAKLTF